MQSTLSALSQGQQLPLGVSSLPKPAEPFVVAPTFRADADNAGDVLVLVQDADFYVHRDLLWFSSSFFRDLLRENWAEGQLADDEEAAFQRGEVDNDAEEDKSRTAPAADPTSAPAELTDAGGQEPTKDVPPPEDSTPVETASADSAGRSAATSAGHDPRTSFHTAQLTLDDASSTSATTKAPAKDESCSLDSSSSLPGAKPTGTDAALPLSPSARSEALPSRETDPSIMISPTLSLQDLQMLETPPSSPRSRLLLASLPSMRSGSPAAATSMSSAISPDRDRPQQNPPPPPPPRPKNTHMPKHRPISKPRGVIVTVLRLEEEEPPTFQSFLTAVYPHLRLAVSWRNIGNLMSFSDKYGVNQSLLFEPCRMFLEASLTGNPIEAMRLAEQFGLQGVFKEASKHVLDLYSAWSTQELSVLSKETLIKLERKRSWFLERLLKFSVANPQRDYECHATCPNPDACAEALQARWNQAYLAAFRFGPPQPTIVWKHLRELEGGGPPLAQSACETACRTWVQTRFDRMFELGLAGPRARSQFLYILLDDTVLAKKAIRRRIRADQLPAPAHAAGGAGGAHAGLQQSQQQQQQQQQPPPPHPALHHSLMAMTGSGLGASSASGSLGAGGSGPGMGGGVGSVMGSLLDFVNPL